MILVPNGAHGTSSLSFIGLRAPRWGAGQFFNPNSRVPFGTLRFHREPLWGKERSGILMR